MKDENDSREATATDEEQKNNVHEQIEAKDQHGEEDSDNGSDSESSSNASSSDDEDDVSEDSDRDVTERTDIPDGLKPQVERLKALRARLAQSTQDNKREVYKEHQRMREPPGEQRRYDRKRREAEILKEREEYQGSDYERSRFWSYSAEQVEKYEEKKRKRQDNVERGFTDFAQVNQRKYERDIAKFKPDLVTYEREKAEGTSGSSHSPVGHKPNPKNVERLVKTVEAQQKKRGALHRPKVDDEDESVSYINEKNARFNRKMNRAYDKHTKEIRDNFERGTAL
ncbi:pre-mRNA-splicing factor SYF2 [Dipsacomyces acuminosporus]|nr:pre-mRNA-splicing factor SYF2 [Dipsacomyces acuminosporus]